MLLVTGPCRNRLALANFKRGATITGGGLALNLRGRLALAKFKRGATISDGRGGEGEGGGGALF
jgi:hypothetical protein